jgi:hypothetical protein
MALVWITGLRIFAFAYEITLLCVCVCVCVRVSQLLKSGIVEPKELAITIPC